MTTVHNLLRKLKWDKPEPLKNNRLIICNDILKYVTDDETYYLTIAIMLQLKNTEINIKDIAEISILLASKFMGQSMITRMPIIQSEIKAFSLLGFNVFIDHPAFYFLSAEKLMRFTPVEYALANSLLLITSLFAEFDVIHPNTVFLAILHLVRPKRKSSYVVPVANRILYYCKNLSLKLAEEKEDISHIRAKLSQCCSCPALSEAEVSILEPPISPRRQLLLDKEYNILQELGRGASGVVHKAEYKDDDEKTITVALKNINLMPDLDSEQIREFSILATLDNPRIVKMWGVNFNSDSITAVLEYLPYTLDKLFRRFYDERIIVSLFKQLLEGLDYIHNCGIVHLDLKPQNILVDYENCSLKIADFGLAQWIATKQIPKTTYIVSLWWRAPELMTQDDIVYTPAIDMWSAGVILAEMLLGKYLFIAQNTKEMFADICNVIGTPTPEEVTAYYGELSIEYKNILKNRAKPSLDRLIETKTERPTECLNLLHGLLNTNPSARLTAKQALKSSIFALG